MEMKGHLSRVNLVKREALLKDSHAISVLSFPNANKKVYLNLYIYAKATKVGKINVNLPISLNGKYLPRFSYVHRRRMTSECKCMYIL